MKTLRNGLYCWKHDRTAIFILKDTTYTYIRNAKGEWDSQALIGNENRLIMLSIKHYYNAIGSI